MFQYWRVWQLQPQQLFYRWWVSWNRGCQTMTECAGCMLPQPKPYAATQHNELCGQPRSFLLSCSLGIFGKKWRVQKKLNIYIFVWDQFYTIPFHSPTTPNYTLVDCGSDSYHSLRRNALFWVSTWCEKWHFWYPHWYSHGEIFPSPLNKQGLSKFAHSCQELKRALDTVDLRKLGDIDIVSAIPDVPHRLGGNLRRRRIFVMHLRGG